MKEKQGNQDKRAYSTTYESTGFRNKQEPFQPIETGPRRAVTRTAPHSAKDIILFKTRQTLEGQPMELSIVRSHNTYEIRASPVNQGEVLKIVLSEEEGNELLEMSNYNYKDIVGRLGIREGVLQLVDEGEGD